MSAVPQEMRSDGKSLFVMVGDLSADKHTSRLIAKLKEVAPDLHIWGVGGPEMAKQDFEALHDCHDFTVIGIFEPVKRLPFFAKLRDELADKVASKQPDAILLVDFSTFNLNLAKSIRKRCPDIPIVYFISPQVWGSRPWRMNTMSKLVSKVLLIFPFEEPLYRSRGLDAQFVGHPLTVNLPAKESLGTREQFRQTVGTQDGKHLIGVFPGSRNSEVKKLMPFVAKAMTTLLQRRNDIQFVIAAAHQDAEDRIKLWIERLPEDSVRIISGEKNCELMCHSDLLWTKSGTTTLEAAMYLTPMVIFYTAPWISFLIFLAFKQVKRVGMPNILARERLVPELIKLDCRADLLVRYTDDLLDVPGLRKEISDKLAGLRNWLGKGEYTINCAGEILKVIDRKSHLRQETQAIL